MSLPVNLSDATPAELLREFVRTRCGEAFAELVRRYAGLVTGTAARVMGSRVAQEDVAQEVFALLARKAAAVDVASLGGWLHRVAVRRATAARRRSDARSRGDLAAFMNTEVVSENEPDPQWAEVLPALDHALDSLPAEDRAVVVLRYYEQLSYHEIAARLPLTAEAARKRTARAIERLGRTLKARGLSTTAASLAAGLAAHWKTDAAMVSAHLAARVLTKSAALPAGVVLTTMLATMRPAQWAGFGVAAACLIAGALALPSLLHPSENDGPVRPPNSSGKSIAAARPAPTRAPSPPPVTPSLFDDALLKTLKIDLRSMGWVEDVKDFHPNGKPKREEAFSLGQSLVMGDRGAASLYLKWWPEENRYCFSFGDSDSKGYYGPFTGSPLTNHDLSPYLLASLEGRGPRFLACIGAGTILLSFVSSSDAALRRYGWDILAAMEKPQLPVAHQLTHQFPAVGEKHLQEDTESPDPALRELMARVHEKLAAAGSYYDSCKDELPAESYQLMAEEDPASVAALAWGPARNGLRAALILPRKVKLGEPFPLSWAVQNTGEQPVRLFYADDGSPGLRWKGPEGTMNTSMYPGEPQNQQHRYLLQPGQCLRVALSSHMTFVEKGPGSRRELPAVRGPLHLTASYCFPGLRSINEAQQKVIFPARGEYEGILESVATVAVE